MNKTVVKLLVLALIGAGLAGWALVERSGRLSALNEVTRLKGDLDLCGERIRETNRAVTALSTATTAAQARLAQLEKDRARSNAPLVASIKRLEATLAKAPPAKGCKDALQEWRNER